MSKFISMTAVAALMSGVAAAQAADLPPDLGPGHCFARVAVPSTYETVLEEIVDKAESVETRIIPATYETVTEQVLVREESIELEIIPATYRTVTETVIIEPERTETRIIPARYETYTEQVLVRPAYTTWQKGDGLYGRTNASVEDGTAIELATGELLCRVEVPAEYETVTRTRLVEEERTETRVIPAVTRTVERQMVDQPARTAEKIIPAVYDTVTVEKLITPAREEEIIIPASFKTVEKRVVVSDGGLEWREVLCDTNSDTQTIAAVQRALTTAGYPVEVDGEFGPSTLTAMEAYQRANGLPVGYLTISTVESLGVSAPQVGGI
ncbi:MAG: peptidoglycan-binding domain-containing protein [Pseudomonadota bacterium]